MSELVGALHAGRKSMQVQSAACIRMAVTWQHRERALISLHPVSSGAPVLERAQRRPCAMFKTLRAFAHCDSCFLTQACDWLTINAGQVKVLEFSSLCMQGDAMSTTSCISAVHDCILHAKMVSACRGALAQRFLSASLGASWRVKQPAVVTRLPTTLHCRRASSRMILASLSARCGLVMLLCRMNLTYLMFFIGCSSA